jgi:hypothetical protein
MKQIGLLIITCLLVLYNFAQQYAGVWEGKLSVDMGKVKSLSVKMELQDDGEIIGGVLYMRGLDGTIFFGCDYIIKGGLINGRLVLEQVKVVRSVAMDKANCGEMYKLSLKPDIKDSSKALTGYLEWNHQTRNKILFSKTTTEITPLGEEDIADYMESRAELFDLSKVFLKPSERYNKKVLDVEIERSEIILELTAADSIAVHDSVSVYHNLELVAGPLSLTKPLRIRVTGMGENINTIVIVNESVLQRNLNIQVKVTNGNHMIQRTIQPGFSRNSLFVFRKKPVH